MAKVIGAVRFQDGRLMYFLYNMAVDACKPRLFSSVNGAEGAWDDPQDDVYDQVNRPGGEVVEVMPLWGFDDEQVRFHSRVDLEAMAIVGPLDDEAAFAEGLYARNFI